MSTMTCPEGLAYKLTDKDQEFYLRMELPPPQLSPSRIIQNLMSFRNERKLHRRKCDYSGASILSAYPTGTPFPVYKNEVWWGDSWDPLEYAKDFDFTKPFFTQFAELQSVVPREGTSIFNSENCEYNSHTRMSRNCYMSSLLYRCEDVYYSYWMADDKDCIDCFLLNNCTLCYECIDCENAYECVYLQDCKNCQNCYFSYQLLGCTNCIGCSNLMQKKNYLFNQAVTEAEFLSFKSKLLNGTFSSWQDGIEYCAQMFSTALHRATHNLNCENVFGDHLINCKNCLMCFDGNNTEDAKYSISFHSSKDVYHCYSCGWPDCELIYNSCVTRGSTNIAFCYYTFSSSNLRYCDSSMSCEECFGCIGLKHKKYCILNKQYSKSEYFALKARIIEYMQTTSEWGKYFPIDLSTFGYNESAAQDYFPLSKQEILNKGWRWQESNENHTKPPSKYKLNNSVFEAEPNIFNQILSCDSSGKLYKLSKQELEFYKKLGVPVPRICPEQRHLSRLKRRNPFQLFKRRCSQSGVEIFSSFHSDRKESVLSEEAYLASVE